MGISQKICSKIYRETKYFGRDVSYALGVNERFFKNARGSRIVIYHGICKHDHTRFNPIFLTRDIFESHLKLYNKYFNVVSLDDFYQQRFSNDKFNVCITFDDGFANNFKYVLPLLEAYKIPATFFITAIRDAGYDILWNDFLGIVSKYGPKTILYKNEHFYKGVYDKYISTSNGNSLVEILRSSSFTEKEEMMQQLYHLAPFRQNQSDNDYWLQMTKEEIKTLSKSPFATVGAHSCYHNDISRITLIDAIDDLTRSKHFLEQLTEKPVNSFAFPYGSYTKPLIVEAKKIGYTQLLAMDYNIEDDQNDAALKERFTVNPFISPINQMYATITCRYEY
jgi:peptidoglycan/xylan/chitin deacetylase (PgdA/CDA1 family)